MVRLCRSILHAETRMKNGPDWSKTYDSNTEKLRRQDSAHVAVPSDKTPHGFVATVHYF
jgi:hypothetical protein